MRGQAGPGDVRGAGRLLAASPDDKKRVEVAHELAFGRLPKGDEAEKALAYLEHFAERARDSGMTPEQARREAWVSYARVLLCGNEFVFVD